MKYFFPVFLVLVLSACTETPSETPTSGEDLVFMSTIERADPEITKTKEFGECVEPTVKMCITQVANEMARKQNSLAFCEKLEDDETINSCKYGVVIAQLGMENSMKSCDVLGDTYKKECRISSILLSAQAAGDPEVCDQISEEYFGDQEDNGSGRVDQCKFPIIMGKEDVEKGDCDALSGKAQKDTCLSMIQNRKNPQ